MQQKQGAADRAFDTSLARLEERCKAEPSGKMCGSLTTLRSQKLKRVVTGGAAAAG